VILLWDETDSPPFAKCLARIARWPIFLVLVLLLVLDFFWRLVFEEEDEDENEEET
jgi:hypothetical protein